MKHEESSEPSSETETASSGLTAEDYSAYLNDDGRVKNVDAGSFLTLPDFSLISFQKKDLEPSEETIDSDLKSFGMRYPVEVKDRAVKDGDLVVMDYSGKLDGVAFQGGTATNQELTAGSNQFVDNFLSKIIGHMPGETFDLDIRFPDSYPQNTDLEAKDTVFTVTIHYIKEGTEITDEWVRSNAADVKQYFGLDDAESVSELRQVIREYYYDNALSEKIRTLLAGLEYKDVPEAMKEYVRSVLDNQISSQYGVSLEVYMAYAGITETVLNETILNDSKVQLAYQAIADSEKWLIDEAAIKEMVGEENFEPLKEHYGLGYLGHYVLMEKAQEYIKETIRIEE
ncbi:MAG: FKBP-type peptidyl-prolyl cis-trans isomerase [Lachnospiraceae bacterium]|nr:FKBP-type peptidyl-prolyl cis-trans isomerase [Lachnospiraceae bacterium]